MTFLFLFGGGLIITLLVILFIFLIPLLALLNVLMSDFQGNEKIMWVLIIIFGVVQSAVTNIAQNIGMQWTEAGVASIIQSVGPVFAVVLAVMFLGEGLTRMKVVGGALAILGTAGIVTGGGEALGSSTLLGNLLMVVTAAAYAVGGTIAKYVLRDVDPTTMMAVGTPFALIPLAIGAAFETDAVSSLQNASAVAWASVIFLALFATGVTMILWYRVLARVELSHLAYFIYLIPVFSVALSWAILGETISAVQALFAGVIIAGVAVSQREEPSTAATVVGAGCEEPPCDDEE